MPKRVQTVLGPIHPEDLGFTLTHEHFSLDFENFYCEPPKQIQKFLLQEKQITLGNVGFVKQYPYGSHYNINFQDKDTHQAVIEDLKLYKEFGGTSIVENTTHGLNRDLHFMYRVAEHCGINVIAGTGHYIAKVQDEKNLKMSVEEMVHLYTNEMINGVDLTLESKELVNVKCGFIGEVASVYPIHDFEKRSIQATAEVQQFLNCGVSFHPHRVPAAPFEIMRIYLEAGGKADKAVMSHLDRTLLEDEQLMEFSDLGCYCQFDLFGTEVSYYQLNPPTDMPSDAQRLDKIVKLIENGKVEKILMSHDIHTKHRLMEFGGHGYAHIINNVVPKMLTSKQITKDQVHQIVKNNPAKWLELDF